MSESATIFHVDASPVHPLPAAPAAVLHINGAAGVGGNASLMQHTREQRREQNIFAERYRARGRCIYAILAPLLRHHRTSRHRHVHVAISFRCIHPPAGAMATRANLHRGGTAALSLVDAHRREDIGHQVITLRRCAFAHLRPKVCHAAATTGKKEEERVHKKRARNAF
jgi:hypothetical protein